MPARRRASPGLADDCQALVAAFATTRLHRRASRTRSARRSAASTRTRCAGSVDELESLDLQTDEVRGRSRFARRLRQRGHRRRHRSEELDTSAQASSTPLADACAADRRRGADEHLTSINPPGPVIGSSLASERVRGRSDPITGAMAASLWSTPAASSSGSASSPPSTASTSTSTAARRSGSSARTAPASRRRCG